MKSLRIAFIFLLFFNQSQSLASDHLEKVLFKNPAEVNKSLNKGVGVKIVPWKEVEKQAISNAIQDVDSLDPRLLKAATKNKELILLRAGQSESDFVASTIATRNVIFIADTFPFKNRRYSINCIIHELIHVLDLESRVSNSKTWGEYAGPIINKVKIEAQFYSRESYQIELKKNRVWPSMYGCKNLSEALAVYCSEQITEKSNKKVKLANKVIASLLDSSEPVLNWKRLVRKGDKFYIRNHYKSAAECFLAANEIEPSSIKLNLKLVRCLLEEKKYSSALKIIQKSMNQLNQWKCLETNEQKIRLLKLKVSLYKDQEQYKQLLETLNEALDSNPFNIFLLESRAICNGHYENLGNWLLDSYRAKGYLGDYVSPVFGIKTDLAYVQMMVNKVVSEHPYSGQALRYRANFYIQLASNSKKQSEKVSYLNLALKDFTNSLQLDDSPKLDTMVRCSQIQIQLKEYNQARLWQKRAKALDSNEILPQIIDVLIDEATGKTKEAKVKSKELYKRISKLKTIKRDNPLKNSFPTLRLHFLFPYHEIRPDDLNIS